MIDLKKTAFNSRKILSDYKKLQDKKEVGLHWNKAHNLVLLKYTQSTLDWENPLVFYARGLVLDNEGKVVAKPYSKFFNYKQLDYLKSENRHTLDADFCSYLNKIKTPSDKFIATYSDWPHSNIKSVSKKLDGSLMIVTAYNGELRAFSSGNTEGKYPDLFMHALNSTLDNDTKEKLIQYLHDRTLLFEYINSKIDPHVIQYKNIGIRLHGMVDNKTFKEYHDYDTLNSIAKEFHFTVVPFLNLKTKQEVLNYIDNAKNEEGVVVSFDNGLVLKLKTAEYWRNFSNISTIYSPVVTRRIKLRLLSLILSGDIDDILPYSSKPIINEISRINALVEEYNDSIISLGNELSLLFFKKDKSRYETWKLVNKTISKNVALSKYKGGLVKIAMSIFQRRVEFDATSFVQESIKNQEEIISNYLKKE